MGVTGLWKLIEPCGKPVPVETLEGKVLAVDISIWLHQVVKGFQDNKGAALNNAHLLGLFHRLCKLMYYRVKPVFVFDGCVPQLKKDTIARRQQQRNKLNTEADRIQALLLQSLAKEKVVQQALGSNADLLLKSPIKHLATSKAIRKEDTLDDMFKLPEMPSCSKSNTNHTEDETTDESINENSFCSGDYTTTSASTDDSSFEESNSRHAYNSNIQAIDVKSKEFQQLPADVRHEILVDIKETRKQSSWGRLHELPSQSDDFSIFQMKRLLKRRDVQVSLEVAEQEMGGHTLTYAELTNIFSEEGILETDVVEKKTKQITSDEHTRFLLVKDLKHRLAKVKEEPIKEEEEIKRKYESITKSTKNEDNSFTSKDKVKNDEYDADLELAIALSLEDDSNRVYDEKDYEYDSDESLKLSKAQRLQLQNAAKGPARSYMIEYAGMNQEEVAGILEKTQDSADLDNTDIERLIGGEVQTELDPHKSTAEGEIRSESQDIRLCVTDSSDGTDSDLEDVEDNDIKSNKNFKGYIELKDSRKGDMKMQCLAKRKSSTENQSKLEEMKDADSTDTDTDLEEVEGSEISLKDIVEKTLQSEDECVIEETPPCLLDEEEVKTKSSKGLNIEIDFSKPLQPEDDLFADIFEDIKTGEKIIEKYPAFAKSTDQLLSEESQPKEDCAALIDKKIKQTELNDKELNPQIKTTSETKDIISILNELKQQANDIKNIRLENIKLSDTFIEISDDEAGSTASNCTKEVIEVCDSDENEKRCSTPPPQTINSVNHSPTINSKSPNYRTPNKNHSITEFFNINYVVKRTPDKPEDNNEEIAKVKSPFFVQKTPRSGRKSGTNSPSLNRKQSSANKTLFDDGVSKESFDKLDIDFLPLKEEKSTSEEDILNEAANILKSQKTTEELSTIASDLAKERQELENERNRQDRMGMSITQRMNSDCQELLRIFGVPFIVAPMEAEAQCAFLDTVQLTNGTITDDSDIWLFGGRTVYKNFFAQNKHVMEFRSEQIEKDFNCDRKKLIQLACLVGSDYTTGIHGIGAVTALEILASFTPKEASIKQTSIQNILDTLQKFRNWWQSFKSAAIPPGSSARLALQKKLKNIELHDGFPSTTVVEAYFSPKVDENKDAFSWGYPDIESLREFARKKFGWTTSKTDEILSPVLKKLNEKNTQQSIRNYFNVKNALSLRQIRVSKRVQNAIEKMSGDINPDEASGTATKPKRSKKTKSGKARKEKEDSEKVVDTNVKQVEEISLCKEVSYNNLTARGPVQRATKRINIPETKEIIPQREKYLAKIEANRKQAAEIFKNTAKESKKRKI